MNTLKTQAHKEAGKDLLEIISATGVGALILDGLWAVRDGILTGFTYGLGLIAVGLLFLAAVAGVALAKYHNHMYKHILQRIMKDKLNACKAKAKRKH